MLEKNIETKKMNAGGRYTNEKRCEKAQKRNRPAKKDRSAKKRRYVGLQRFGIVNQRIDVITVVLDAVVEIGQQLAVYVVVEE